MDVRGAWKHVPRIFLIPQNATWSMYECDDRGLRLYLSESLFFACMMCGFSLDRVCSLDVAYNVSREGVEAVKSGAAPDCKILFCCCRWVCAEMDFRHVCYVLQQSVGAW